jgi:3-oxoadipate enol-lactonase
MPTVKINDTNVYYEIHGEGEPLILIPGLRNNVSEYEGIITLLEAKYKVVALDNRGAGRSDKPDIPYTIEMMADDAAGLLHALDIQQAHILGVSLGGRIAADLALRHSERVKSLILVSTRLTRQTQRSWPGLFVDLALRIPFMQRMDKYPQPYYASLRQREAARIYDCSDRLSGINIPTLILHGKTDRIAPYRQALEMNAGIKGSKMIAFNGGHIFLFFQPRRFTDAVIEFLEGLKAEYGK